MVQLTLYRHLSTRSKRAIARKSKRFGKRYNYNPRIDLLRNLAAETGMTVDRVREQLLKEREFILAYRQYF